MSDGKGGPHIGVTPWQCLPLCEHACIFGECTISSCSHSSPLVTGIVKQKHSHYYKDVTKLKSVDVYRVLQLFNVTDPCIQHAVKKLLVAGGRGAGKDISKDVQEAIDSLERWKEMRTEES